MRSRQRSISDAHLRAAQRAEVGVGPGVVAQLVAEVVDEPRGVGVLLEPGADREHRDGGPAFAEPGEDPAREPEVAGAVEGQRDLGSSGGGVVDLDGRSTRCRSTRCRSTRCRSTRCRSTRCRGGLRRRGRRGHGVRGDGLGPARPARGDPGQPGRRGHGPQHLPPREPRAVVRAHVTEGRPRVCRRSGGL